MNDLQLVKPSIEMKRLALYFKNEFFDHCVTVINGGLKFDNIENYEGWLHIVHSSFSPETVNPKWGVTHTFFAVRAEDQKIVGIINLRLFLTEKFANSGHIGYSFRIALSFVYWAIQLLYKQYTTYLFLIMIVFNIKLLLIDTTIIRVYNYFISILIATFKHVLNVVIPMEI